MTRAETLIGVDLGGTTIKLAAYQPGTHQPGTATLSHERSVPTRAFRPRDEVLADLVAALRSLSHELHQQGQPPYALGVGVPAAIDAEAATLLVMPNFAPDWQGFALPYALQEATGLKTVLVNDARAFTLAETHAGAARGYRHVLGVVLGTGVGGGLVLNGQLYLGAAGGAGEFGHQVYDPHGPPCGCGGRGCIETYASGPALVAAVTRAFMQGRAPRLRELAAGDLNAVTPALVAQAAAQGEVACAEVFRHAGQVLGLGIANLVVTVAPERVVVGGGIAQAGELLLGPIRETLDTYAQVARGRLPQVVAASLGTTAGVLGAALYAHTKQVAP